MSYPKIKPCPKCENADMSLYGYGDHGPLNWHVECDECFYLGPCGNKLQAIRLHNNRVVENMSKARVDHGASEALGEMVWIVSPQGDEGAGERR